MGLPGKPLGCESEALGTAQRHLQGSKTRLGSKFMGLDANDTQHVDPAPQEDKSQEASCYVQGRHNARCQVELVHYDAENGPD